MRSLTTGYTSVSHDLKTVAVFILCAAQSRFYVWHKAAQGNAAQYTALKQENSSTYVYDVIRNLNAHGNITCKKI